MRPARLPAIPMDMMPTPTFPETADNARATPDEAFAALRRGDFSPAPLMGLSDLGRADVQRFATEWAELPESSRVAALRAMNQLAEENVLCQFGRVCRVALDDPSEVVRQLAIAGLWEDESGELADRLLAALADDTSVDVRAKAATALG